MNGPVAALLGDGSRLHLQHGPIDLVIGVDTPDRHGVFGAAARRFDTVLSELVKELPLLRSAMSMDAPVPDGKIARRMDAAVRPYAPKIFVTRMAAVAGAVADEVLAAMVAQGPVSRAYVNNGGDIALHLGTGASYAAAIAGLDGADQGRVDIDAASPVRGIATSGQGGRSLSLGIADSVTVLARNAAEADVAATLIANAVDLAGHPAITRTRACDIDPDSDLGARLVVSHVGVLLGDDVDRALSNGAQVAQGMLGCGQIMGAALSLNREQRIIGAMAQDNDTQTRMVQHA